MPEERLQKILSRTGVASRRQAEDIIREGRVVVNGAVVTEMGSKADLDRDHIKVDGRLLRANHALCTLLQRSGEDLCGAPFSEFLVPDDADTLNAQLQPVLTRQLRAMTSRVSFLIWLLP